MKRQIQPLAIFLSILCAATPIFAQAFSADESEIAAAIEAVPRKTSSPSVPNALRAEIVKLTEEILDGPWAPLCSDCSAHQANAKAAYEWTYIRPGDEILALADSEPYLPEKIKLGAKDRVRILLEKYRPSSNVFIDFKQGKERNLRKPQALPNTWLSEDKKNRLLFWAAYPIWAGASAFGLWNEAKPCYGELKALRQKIEADLEPRYAKSWEGPLNSELLADQTFRLNIYESMLSGYLDHYHYHARSEAEARMGSKGKDVFMYDQSPVFFYVKWLAALSGYYRLARHYNDVEEAKWAKNAFIKTAKRLISDKAAPYLWCDDAMTPEISSLLRKSAGKWLDEIAKTPNIGVVPATDWDKKVVPGVVKKRVINPHTWFYAWGNHGEGVHPRTVFAAYLAHAWLLGASDSELEKYLDIPWCSADLYQLRKLALIAGNYGKKQN